MTKTGRRRRSSIDGRTTRHPGYAQSQRRRKLVEAAFGWIKTVAGQAKTRFRGLERVGWSFQLAAAAYNLIRLPNRPSATLPGTRSGVDKVREFAGSLVERGATKGVFVTTSHFAPAAKAYADRIPQRLILIDGDELTRLMVQYGVGVRTERTIELRKLDLGYFDEEEVVVA